MKRLIFLTLLVLLTGCVSYYAPETALEDGVYYAEDDPAYVLNSSDYSGVVYYPWSSLDYFYLGYGHYYGYSIAYGYPYGWGYSPWGYPYGYHGYYSARFAGPYRHRSFRGAHKAYCPGNANCQPSDNVDHDNVYDSIAREDGERRYEGKPDGKEERSATIGERKMARNRQEPVRRYGASQRGRHSGTQNKVIRNNDKTKSVKSRTEPAKTIPVKNVSVERSPSVITTPRPASTSSGGYSRGRSRPATASYSTVKRNSGQARPSRRKDRD